MHKISSFRIRDAVLVGVAALIMAVTLGIPLSFGSSAVAKLPREPVD